MKEKLISTFSASFKDKSLEKRYISYSIRRTSGKTLIPLMLLLYSTLTTLSIDITDYFKIQDSSLFPITFIFLFSIIFSILALLIKKMFKFYLKSLVFISLLTPLLPLERMQIIASQNNGSINLEITLLSIIVLSCIRSALIAIPIKWTHFINALSIVLFIGIYSNYTNNIEFAKYFLPISITIFGIIAISLIAHQYNIALRKGFYEKYTVRLALQKSNRKIIRLHKIENAYVAEGTAQILAHEIKGTIALIQANIDLISDDLKKINTTALNRIQKGLERASLIITKNKSLKKIKVENPVLIDCKEIIQTSLLMTGYTKGLTVKGKNYKFKGEYHLIEGALSNIIKNAFESSSDKKAELLISKKDGNLVIDIISNSKIDFNKEELFKLFPSTNKRDSTGVGLAFVKSVIKAHKGYISCYEKNEKVIFNIKLPLNY